MAHKERIRRQELREHERKEATETEQSKKKDNRETIYR